MINYTMEELLPLVAKLAEKYTSKESSSISYDKAKQLMEAVIYCINEFNQGELRNQESTQLRQKESNAEEDYKRGYELVVKKVLQAKKVYERVLEQFDSYGNISLEETIQKGIPGFFQYYDPRFEPQNHILTMDYPTLVDPLQYCGIDAIDSYLNDIELEQKFLHAFPRDYVISILECFQEDYKQLFINLSSIVYRNIIGCMIARKSWTKKGFEQDDLYAISSWMEESTEEGLYERLQGLLALMLQKGYKNPKEIQEYLNNDLSDFAVEMINAKKNYCLNRLFVL